MHVADGRGKKTQTVIQMLRSCSSRRRSSFLPLWWRVGSWHLLSVIGLICPDQLDSARRV